MTITMYDKAVNNRQIHILAIVGCELCDVQIDVDGNRNMDYGQKEGCCVGSRRLSRLRNRARERNHSTRDDTHHSSLLLRRKRIIQLPVAPQVIIRESERRHGAFLPYKSECRYEARIQVCK